MKTHQNPPCVHSVLPEPLYFGLTELARKQDRSRSAIVRILISQAVREAGIVLPDGHDQTVDETEREARDVYA